MTPPGAGGGRRRGWRAALLPAAGRIRGGTLARATALIGLWGLALGCAPDPAGPVPSAAEVESYYIYPPGLEASVEEAVTELRVVQPREQLERGGRLWARAGPYFFLFSEDTRELFEDFTGLTAVRAVTETPEGEEVARAFLHRDGLTATGWRRALNITGRARTEGTERPTRLEELVRWGEEHTDFEYASEFQG